jgi:acyl-CoA synthetase (AMP-forming)/AMP-acid ligase II
MQFQLADLFECLCDARPDAEAVIAGERRLSRAALDARANRLARHLLREGVGAGDHVGVYAYNRIEWIEALVACWKIRAAAVNVNYRYVTDELRYIWDNSDMVALVYERGFAERVATLAPEFPALRSYLVLEDGSDAGEGPGCDYEAVLAAQSETRDFGPRSSDDIYLVYTGGTTGMPKGVLWRHEDFYRNVIAGRLGKVDTPEAIAKQADNPLGMRTLTLSPLMHGGGQFPFMITVLNGGVGLFPVSRSFDPHEVLSIIARERVTTLSIIGDAMGRPIAEAKLDGDYDTRSLLAISTGGAILTDPVRDLLRKAFGKIYLTGGIGSSEIGSAAKETSAFDPSTGPRFRLDSTVAVLDDDLESIAPGSDRIGRLARSGHIPLGYYKDEKKTAETFVTDARGVRWVLPGDYARVEADGMITLLGRGSQCINSGGEKIFPDEVEAVLARHPAVRHAAVVGVPDPTWQQRVVALVELKDADRPVDLEDVQAHCRKHLAGYKVPRDVLTTELRRTPTGKLDIVWALRYAEKTLAGRDRSGAGEAR